MATYRYLDDGTTDGTILGQSTASKLSFYAATPVVRPSGAAQNLITDGSGGTANTTTGVTLTATLVTADVRNAFATVVAQGNALQAALVSLGLIKGSA